jgi:hypothetical protein
MKIKKETSSWDHLIVQKSGLFLYNSGNVLKTRKGERACPLPLPTPAHCDSALLPVPGVIIIGCARVAGQAEGKAPWNVIVGVKLVVYPILSPEVRVYSISDVDV